jgi:glutamyl-tRNA reductase
MRKYHISKHNSFYTVGLSYKKANADIRGKFSLDQSGIDQILIRAKEDGIDGLMVISTCNRTELHGFAQHPFQLIKLLCEVTSGNAESFEKVGYVYKNYEAITHMFRVGTGLDSQILGDFEIISQLKKSFSQAKKHGLTNHFLERLCNSVIRASKRIKNETEISSGTTSVAFASVQYILNSVPEVSDKHILLFGTGKIGRNTCENLVKHTDNAHITLINRTKDKAERIGGKLKLLVQDFKELPSEINKADILIVATGAQNPTINKQQLTPSKPLLILDLSIPRNVSTDVTEIDGVSLVHLDHLSKITDDTLERRKQFIPQAESIITEVQAEFTEWLESRKFAPVIKALKDKLQRMKAEELDFQSKKQVNFDSVQAELVSDRIIHKITKQFANHLKETDIDTDDSLELIRKVFRLEVDTP